MEKNKVYLETTVAEFNCSARNLDESLLIEYFLKNNCSIVDNPKIADVILINTCAAYKKCVDYSLEIAGERKKLNKRLIICGCLPSVNPKLLKDHLGEEIFSFSPKNMDAIDSAFPHFEFKIKDIKDANDIKPEDKENKDSVFIRIARGCPCNCSYCAIKKAVGQLKSKTMEDIEDEFITLIKEHSRIVLVGEDLGAYGLDIGTTLPELLRRLSALSNKETTIYFPSLNTNWFMKYKSEIFDIFKNEHIEKSFGVQLQSGSNRILDLMKRHNKIERVEESIIEFRDAFPDVPLSSCFIIGFPTETDDDFQKSINIMGKKYFDYIGVFKYYESENMDSFHLNPKVDRNIIEERAQIVSDLLRRNEIQFRIG